MNEIVQINKGNWSGETVGIIYNNPASLRTIRADDLYYIELRYEYEQLRAYVYSGGEFVTRYTVYKLRGDKYFTVASLGIVRQSVCPMIAALLMVYATH